MKYLYFLITFTLLFSGCVTFRFWDIPEDLSVKYHSKGHLVDFEQNIVLTEYWLKMNYVKPKEEKKYAPRKIKGDPMLDDIYSYIKEIDFLEKTQPVGEMLSDATDESITVSYDGETKTIYFGNLKDPPEYITKLRTLIFNFATYYFPDWKNDNGQ